MRETGVPTTTPRGSARDWVRQGNPGTHLEGGGRDSGEGVVETRAQSVNTNAATSTTEARANP